MEGTDKIIKIKFHNNNAIELIKQIKLFKLNNPNYVYNIDNNLFKVELKKIEDKDHYRKKFRIEDFYKSYVYKIKINNNTIRNHELEQVIKKHTGVTVEVSKLQFNGVDTGIVNINARKKIERNKRTITINKIKFRIECRNGTEEKVTRIWKKVPDYLQHAKQLLANAIDLKGKAKISEDSKGKGKTPDGNKKHTPSASSAKPKVTATDENNKIVNKVPQIKPPPVAVKGPAARGRGTAIRGRKQTKFINVRRTSPAIKIATKNSFSALSESSEDTSSSDDVTSTDDSGFSSAATEVKMKRAKRIPNCSNEHGKQLYKQLAERKKK